MLEKIKDIIKQEAAALLNIPVDGNQIEEAVEAIYQSTFINKGKLVTSGMGKAGQIALNMATTFSSSGTPAVFLHPSEAQHGDLGVLQENDIMLLISNSGRTREIIELTGLSKNLNPNIKLIVITSQPGSELGQIADYVLNTGNPKEVCPLGLTPTTSTTVMTVLGDVLVVLLMEKIGFSTADYAKRHHGGYLGEKSRAAS